MGVNLDKPHLWKKDTQTSVDQYNRWFMKFAPKAFRKARVSTTEQVQEAILGSNDLRDLSPDLLHSRPGILPTLRMSCCPPLAVDRLVGLAAASKNLVKKMEKDALPARMARHALSVELTSITNIIKELLDPDIFVWIPERRTPTDEERFRASTIVADRLTGAVANPVIKNAQEERQLNEIEEYLTGKGYTKVHHPAATALQKMPPGTFMFHYAVVTGAKRHKVKVSVDVVIQPHVLRPNMVPIMVEAKSAGDFTNTNKRRKEEAKKISQLKATYGDEISYVLFLCGYFDGGYLGYEAQEGIDWVWEHRMEDLDEFGI